MADDESIDGYCGADPDAARKVMIAKLRIDRDAAANRGDNGEALILNDRINDLKGGSSLTVERVMKEFESGLMRKQFYNPRGVQ